MAARDAREKAGEGGRGDEKGNSRLGQIDICREPRDNGRDPVSFGRRCTHGSHSSPLKRKGINAIASGYDNRASKYCPTRESRAWTRQYLFEFPGVYSAILGDK